MNVIFIEPSFPLYQKQFVRGLAEVGATVLGIGERPRDWLDPDVGEWLTHYEQVRSVVDVDSLEAAVRFVQSRIWVDRLEATIEAHVEAAAAVRERCGIPGTSVRTAWLCRDKPAMKEALRKAGIPCAQSAGATDAEQLRAFARAVGYPLIVKPRSGAGAAGTLKVDNDTELEAAIPGLGFQHGNSVAVEEFIEGHEAFYDTITINGEVAHEFISHYYPNVLEAMRTRWISPVFITTNRIDSPGYDEVKAMGRRVIPTLGIGTSATHMEWFFGPRGLKFSEIACRPPGVGAWDLYCAANDMDVYREWAMAIGHGRRSAVPSRRYSAGIIALRPDRDGVIAGYDGLDEVHRLYGELIIDYHLPSPGTPTQPVEAGYMANAWIRMRHPDYDELRSILTRVGEIAHVRTV
ncbi:MAG TPA: ATP-grasp domain-containing protein [Acidimicrobiia bacterium]|nr:ATP-grasp domain-containing protein [Acidimicrobiia bacterium]